MSRATSELELLGDCLRPWPLASARPTVVEENSGMGELDEDALEVVTGEEEDTLDVTLDDVVAAAFEVVVAALEVVVAAFEVVVGARAAPRPGANTTFELVVDTKTGTLLEELLGA